MVRDTLVGFEAVTGSTLSDYIALGAGGMTANGGAGKDTMIGGDGDDVFVISSGIDHEWLEEIHGNGGDDEIRFSSVIENDTLFLSWLVDVEEVRMLAADGSENNTLRLNINATGLGDRASIRLYGNEANNLVVGNEDGYNTIEGGDGNDSIMGGSMEDSLVGGAGMDSLTGGAGVDNFTGGSGADLFIQTTGAAPTSAGGRSATFGNGVDYVSDFNASEGDVLQGDGSALASSSIAVMDALPASGTYLFRGDWSAGTKIFSINNTGDDIMYATVTVTAGVLTGVSANAMILEGGFASFNVATNFVA
jgi:Ca2+-binding RTX toxin-like protein